MCQCYRNTEESTTTVVTGRGQGWLYIYYISSKAKQKIFTCYRAELHHIKSKVLAFSGLSFFTWSHGCMLELNFCHPAQCYKTWFCLCTDFSKIISISGGLILAADYSQLELRILAHLSHDHRLIQVLNTGADVFRSIAAEWKMIEPESVGDDLRQQAKQVVFTEHV